MPNSEFSLADYVNLLRDTIYDNRPSSIPFNGGDRAKLLGFESAEAFALRKISEQDAREESRIDKTGKVRRRGPLTAGIKPGGF